MAADLRALAALSKLDIALFCLLSFLHGGEHT